MNTGKQFKHTRMALEILRESENLRFRLAVSIRSGSSPDLLVGRLETFFRLEKKRLFTQLGILGLKLMFGKLAEITMSIFRTLWLKLAKAFKSSGMVN